MDRLTRKKLRIVLISFFILSIPIGYFAYASKLCDEAYDIYEKSIISEKNEDIELALQKIRKAKSYAFYNKNLLNIEVQLLYQQKEYRKALKVIENKDFYTYKALLYEHLNISDSALICYEKSIPILKELVRKKKNEITRVYEIERQIALFYTFLNQKENAIKFLKEIPHDYDPTFKEILLHYDYYIENYNSGGYMDFMEGETVKFGTDSIPENINIDSLINANRFFAEGSMQTKDQREYEIKKIFEQKAIKIGMNKIK